MIVTFKAPTDGASGTFENDQTTATSDADGNATSAIFTANAAVGSYTVMAMLTANSTSFSLENTTAVVEPPPLPAVTALSPSNGAAAGGTSVTITGSDISAATAVNFAPATAPISATSSPRKRRPVRRAAPGTATVAVAKDPKACMYTIEGTMVHDLMQNVYKSDRRMKVMGELEVTLTAADKAAIKASQAAKAAEMGIEASMISGGIPDKIKLAM